MNTISIRIIKWKRERKFNKISKYLGKSRILLGHLLGEIDWVEHDEFLSPINCIDDAQNYVNDLYSEL